MAPNSKAIVTAAASQTPDSRKNHPVWDVYDLLRTARLNAQYWAIKGARVKEKNRNLEILLAICVPSSAVAAWPLWSSPNGVYAWAVIAGVGSIVAVVKPFLKLTDFVQAYEATVARYRAVEGELSELRTEIAQQRKYSSAMKECLRQASRAMRRAKENEPIEILDEGLRDMVEERIRLEMPGNSFYVPQE